MNFQEKIGEIRNSDSTWTNTMVGAVTTGFILTFIVLAGGLLSGSKSLALPIMLSFSFWVGLCLMTAQLLGRNYKAVFTAIFFTGIVMAISTESLTILIGGFGLGILAIATIKLFQDKRWGVNCFISITLLGFLLKSSTPGIEEYLMAVFTTVINFFMINLGTKTAEMAMAWLETPRNGRIFFVPENTEPVIVPTTEGVVDIPAIEVVRAEDYNDHAIIMEREPAQIVTYEEPAENDLITEDNSRNGEEGIIFTPCSEPENPEEDLGLSNFQPCTEQKESSTEPEPCNSDSFDGLGSFEPCSSSDSSDSGDSSSDS